jgi:hypothetical protein
MDNENLTLAKAKIAHQEEKYEERNLFYNHSHCEFVISQIN